jgi:hypothetical protein
VIRRQLIKPANPNSVTKVSVFAPAIVALAARNGWARARALFAANGDVGMGYAAIALAIMGLIAGTAFRLRVVLLLVALLLLVSVVVAVSGRFSFLNTALTILIAQAIFQTSYFLGLVTASVFHWLVARDASAVVTPSSDRDQAPAGEEHLMAFDTPNRMTRLPRLFARGIAQHR